MALTPGQIIRMPAPALRGTGGAININVEADWHDPVRFVATSGALASFVAGFVYDGLTLVANQYFLYQPVTAGVSTPGATNGIYRVNAGAPTRRTTEDTGAELLNCAVLVQEGTLAGQAWICVNPTAPNVGTDPITFVPFQGAGEGDIIQLDASDDIAAYADGADIISTGGFTTYADAGGRMWKRGGLTPPAPPAGLVSLPAFFQRQAFDGHYYEAITKRTVYGEQIGIFGSGSGTDCTDIMNDIFKWFDVKGGGRLILPPGIVSCHHATLPVTLDGDGIWLQGSGIGNSQNGSGTKLRLGRVAAGAKMIIGNDAAAGGTERYLTKISDLAVVGVGNNSGAADGYMFESRKVRGLKFRDIQLAGGYGFHQAGNGAPMGSPVTYPNLTKQVFYENIEGNLTGLDAPVGEPPTFSSNSEHFIYGVNLGNFYMSNVNVEGGYRAEATRVNPPEGAISPGSFIWLGTGAKNHPDGVLIVNCGAGKFTTAIDIGVSTANWLVATTWFDTIKTRVLSIHPDGGVTNMKFTACHFAAGFSLEGVFQSNAIAVYIGIDTGGEVTNFEISDSHFVHWGLSVLRIIDMGGGGVGLKFVDNIICNGSAFADDANSAIYIGSGVNVQKITIENNSLFNASVGILPPPPTTSGIRVPTNNKPKYGIDVQSDDPQIVVRNNVVYDFATAAINNPSRASLKTRHVYGNSGQVFEGRMFTLGPWSKSSIAAGQTDQAISLAGGGGPDEMVHRRCRLVAITARGSAVPVGTLTFKTTLNTSGFVSPTLTCTATATAQAFNENLDGIEISAGDRVGIKYSSGAITTGDWAVFLHFIYD